jgi:hypothetical protein
MLEPVRKRQFPIVGDGGARARLGAALPELARQGFVAAYAATTPTARERYLIES